MPSALSVNLRERVIEAVEAGSSSGKRPSASVSGRPAIRWHARFRDAREIAPKPVGGDRSPPTIKAHAETILEICREHP